MNEFKKMRKSEKKAAVDAGIVRRVAKETGYTTATVSRTLAGKFDRPNPLIVAALNRALVELNAQRDAA